MTAAQRAAGTFLALVLGFGAVVIILPGHAAARCFGVPESEEVGLGWYVNLTVSSEDGLSDTAQFGAAAGARDIFDTTVDTLEQNLTDRPLLLYFALETDPGFIRRGYTTAITNVSVNSVTERETEWPLVVEYREDPIRRFTLSWDAGEAKKVPDSWNLTIGPKGEGPEGRVDMRTTNAISFDMGPGVQEFQIYGTNTPAEPTLSLPAETLATAALVYGALMGLVMALRARRKSRQVSADREEPEER